VKLVVAVDEPRGGYIAAELVREGEEVLAVVAASALSAFSGDAVLGVDGRDLVAALTDADLVVLEATRHSLTAATVTLCDRVGTRILPLCATSAEERLAVAFGLDAPLPLEVEPWRIVEAGSVAPPPAVAAPTEPARAPVITVWGPAGSPGRSTLAIELAVELARGGRRTALVDADTHAPSLALSLGLVDEGPGFAAACRHAELGGLDARELTRISTPLGRGGVDVLTGINRPSRWPELSETRVTAALQVCRSWVDHTVVDVSASLERDEEIVSDLVGPRRNAATLASLGAADLVVAVVSADPVGVSRFLRGYSELRAVIGATPVAVVANRLRPGSLGIDARGQVRRALDRFGGIQDIWFVPMDPRSVDAAMLAARPVAEVAPRSPLTLAVRRFVGEAVAPPATEVRGPSRRRSRARALVAR